MNDIVPSPTLYSEWIDSLKSLILNIKSGFSLARFVACYELVSAQKSADYRPVT
jgi:hypothetical protein